MNDPRVLDAPTNPTSSRRDGNPFGSRRTSIRPKDYAPLPSTLPDKLVGRHQDPEPTIVQTGPVPLRWPDHR